MNKDIRGTIDFCENRLKGNLFYLWELYIYGKVRAKLDRGAIVLPIFTSIQIFSLILCYLSTTPEPILSWAYFNTPARLFSRSDLVGILWLAVALARINKRKWSLKKEQIKQNLNTIAEDFSLKKIVCIQDSPALCQPFLPYKLHTERRTLF